MPAIRPACCHCSRRVDVHLVLVEYLDRELTAMLCKTGTEQTVIPLTGLVQRARALGHAINRSGGPQSLVVTTRVGRINPRP